MNHENLTQHLTGAGRSRDGFCGVRSEDRDGRADVHSALELRQVDDESECLAGPHCMGCGLKNCPVGDDGGLK